MLAAHGDTEPQDPVGPPGDTTELVTGADQMRFIRGSYEVLGSVRAHDGVMADRTGGVLCSYT